MSRPFGYKRTPQEMAWMREPWKCEKCGLETVRAGKGTHLIWCGREAEHFWSRVDKTGECWPHTGCRDKWGYAHVGIKGKRSQAHRVAYTFANGPIPAGLKVLHRCDNPPCCNPAHLFLGTDADNSADMYAKGRDRSIGEKNFHAKLTDEKVMEGRRMRRAGWKYPDLAAHFGVAVATMVNACAGNTWKHLPDPIPQCSRHRP